MVPIVLAAVGVDDDRARRSGGERNPLFLRNPAPLLGIPFGLDTSSVRNWLD